MNINDLSDYQLYKLKSLDPNLTPNWRGVLQDILPDLDHESRYSLFKNLLEPRGIYLNASEELVHKPSATLKETMGTIQTHNDDLLTIVSHMFNIIDSRSEYYDAMQLADEIEAIFGLLDKLNVRNLLYEHKNRKKITIAFLYDLAKWIDNTQLKISSSFRKIDSDMIKSYLKEVFIKQKIQGQDFRQWDSSDTDFLDFTYIPSFIRNEGKGRKFFIVEADEYWFLIGSTDKIGKNPYSFRRFLYEDCSSSSSREYIYLTHVVIKKYNLNDPNYLSHCSVCMSRLYTLDLGTPDTILDFVREIRLLRKTYLKPLLKQRLEQSGGSIEYVIKERMIAYEKQASVLILQKIPRIQKLVHNKNDRDYLIYHLDRLFKEMIESVQNFRLQPLAMHSPSSEILLVKLMALRRLLAKSQDFIFSQELTIEKRSAIMGEPLLMIQKEVNDANLFIKESENLEDELNAYFISKEKANFWRKITLGRQPKYTLEDISEEKLKLRKEVFISIIRRSKSQNRGMVYVEFECEETINHTYRHYALADGELGISRLPRVLRLPEDKKDFDINYVSQIVNESAFEANQSWYTPAQV